MIYGGSFDRKAVSELFESFFGVEEVWGVTDHVFCSTALQKYPFTDIVGPAKKKFLCEC
jgi:hypothetical protein